MRMLNTAANLQHFLGRPVEALPDLVHNELDPQQYTRTLLLAPQCMSERCQHWDVPEESSDTDEKCHGVSVYW